ncbi:glycosyltransferase family 39 protein [Geobacillus subterraneus]|uniref:ArnT family glycosyltransferase n=1 Tax=Geobacillus subterraneus TaxID=129338 RepID=UPI002AC8EDFF|nr:glycosyltransferase family 39 protein [Geobacillus subterraneus]WPZ18114.1 glycosyltransferase family 39 protein [Geobacillus subterraneus]
MSFRFHPKIAAWFVVLLAFTLRLFALWTYGLHLTLGSDDMGYVRSAKQLLETGMLTYHRPDEPTVHIMPGMPLLLAALFFVFGTGDVGLYAAKLVMIAFGTGSVYLIYLLGNDLGRPWAGVTTALGTALFIPLIETDNLTLTEAPFLFGFLLFIRFAIRLGRHRHRADFYKLLAAYLFCLFFRPTIALVPFALLAYFLLIRYPLRLAIKQAAIAAVLVVLALSPWWVRNYMHYGEFIPLTGSSGDPLLLGTYQGYGYRYGPSYKEVVNTIETQHPTMTHYEKEKVKKAIAIERIKTWYRANPKQWWESYTIKKAKTQWEQPFYWIEIFGVSKQEMTAWHQRIIRLAFASALFALFTLKRQRRELLFFLLLIAYFTALNNVFFAYPRYNLPLMPILFLWIGLFLSSIAWRPNRKKAASP